MECGTRRRRTLAERRESDKLRQRRFRAKKREQANLLKEAIGAMEESPEKKGKSSVNHRRTAEQIRETNRIRQQRFRARKRGIEEGSIEETIEELLDQGRSPSEDQMILEDDSEDIKVAPTAAETVDQNPVDFLNRLMLQAATEEKDRQTEIRRAKDRIRKRRERQRKREKQMKRDGVEFERKMEQLEKDMHLWEHSIRIGKSEAVESPVTLVKQEVEEPEEDQPTSSTNGFSDSSNLLAQLEQMGLMLAMGTPADEPPPESAETPEGSPSPPFFPEELQDLLEKKPWQRCSNSEERRERERMRKRVYRAKQKFITTGRLEMRWDPKPITRTPNEDEEGVTPIPEWTKNLSAEQKQAAHRIYNKRYRERIRNEQPKKEIKLEEPEEEEEPTGQMETDLSNLPPEIYNEILSVLSQSSASFMSQIGEKDE